MQLVDPKKKITKFLRQLVDHLLNQFTRFKFNWISISIILTVLLSNWWSIFW